MYSLAFASMRSHANFILEKKTVDLGSRYKHSEDSGHYNCGSSATAAVTGVS